MSGQARETALALCAHEIRSAYALIVEAKERLLVLSFLDLNDRPEIAGETEKIEAYLAKAAELVAEIKRKMGVV